MLMTSLQRGQGGGLLASGLPLDVAPLLRGPEHLPPLRLAGPALSRRQGMSTAASGRPAPRRSADRCTGVLCVHFSADGREHGMWFVGPEDDQEPTSPSPRLPAGLTARWHTSPEGTPRADVRRAGDVLCDALLLTADPATTGYPGDTYAPASARQARAALRAEGLPAHQASLLTQTRQRPLLATVARRAELPAPMARQLHRMLLATLRGDVPAPAAVAV